MKIDTHPTPDQLAAFAAGELGAAETSEIQTHLDSCDGCCRALDAAPTEAVVRVLRRAASPPPMVVPDTATSPDTAVTPPIFSGPSSAASRAPLPRIPGYEVLDVLGHGGMGVVYKARHIALKRLVALKMIKAGAHADFAELARFRTEAEAVARLQHAHIVQIYEVGEHEGLPYFALEFCPGGSLDKKLAGAPLPPREAAQLVEKLARAMHHAHQQGVIHRDLKPANVLLAAATDQGESAITLTTERFKMSVVPRITDFGLAKKLDTPGQTHSGAIMGTPNYMAPEQASGQTKEIGPAADVYALGAILYELLTGRPPFKAATPLETIMQVMAEEPVAPSRLNPGVPRDLETVCLKCLQKIVAGRYQSTIDLAEDLRRFWQGEPIRARRVGRLERTAKWMHRNKVLSALLASVVFLVVLASAAGLWYRANRISQEAELSVRRVSLNAEVRAALDESERLQTKVNAALADPQLVNELLSRIYLWDDLIKTALAGWTRAEALIATNPALLDQELADRRAVLSGTLEDIKEDWKFGKDLDDNRARAFIRIELKPIVVGIQLGDRDRLEVNTSKAGPRYEQIFLKAGLDVRQAKLVAVPSRFRRPSLRYVLAAALDHWIMINDDGSLTSRLLEIVRGLDPDPWRDQVRNQDAWQNVKMLEHLAKDADLSQHSPQVLLLLANSLLKTKASPLPFLRRALDQSPRDLWLNQYIAQASKNGEERAGCCHTALAVRPNAISHSNLGRILAQNEDLERAVFHYERAIALDSEFFAAHYGLGMAMLRKNQIEKAALHFEKSLQIEPSSAPAHFALGSLLMEKKDYERAIVHLRHGKSLDAGFPLVDDTLAVLHHEIGVDLHFKKQRERAITHFREALTVNPNYALAHYSLGNSLREKKDLAGAVVHYRNAIGLKADLAQAHCNLGLSLMELGEFSEALSYLEKGHEIGSVQASWSYASRDWIRQCKVLVTLEGKLPEMLERNTGSISDRLLLAEICQRFKKRYYDAVVLYEGAFQRDSALQENLVNGYRYNAACAAALAAAGKGSGKIAEPEQRARLRKRSLDWLQADLAARKRLMGKAARVTVKLEDDFHQWRREPSLATLRDDEYLSALSASEQEAASQLWKEVDIAVKDASAYYVETTHKGYLDTKRNEEKYALQITSGHTYVIDMESDGFHSRLSVLMADGKLLTDDDGISRSHPNSRLIFAAPATEACHVVATSFQRCGIGNLTLRIRDFGSLK